jgi:hypothetical protein
VLTYFWGFDSAMFANISSRIVKIQMSHASQQLVALFSGENDSQRRQVVV